MVRLAGKYRGLLSGLLSGFTLLTPACATTDNGEHSAAQGATQVATQGDSGNVAPGPVAAAPALAKQGKRLYALVCARCHGLNMVLTGESTFNLREFPLDQKERFVESVTKGKRAMPAWGGMVSPEEIEALWAYVNTRGIP
jgi:mono/diheme cytochrome c family protein